MSSGAYDHLYKIILIGDATVGKSYLLSRYIKNSLPPVAKATIGVEFATRTVPLQTGGTVKAQIWDTAGQERYRSITSAHYRRAVGAVLVYDVTNRQSFTNVQKWLDELRQAAEPDVIVILVGNKVDLLDKSPLARQVPLQMAQKFAEECNIQHFEASAVTGYNVKQIFEHLLQEIFNLQSRAAVNMVVHSESVKYSGPHFHREFGANEAIREDKRSLPSCIYLGKSIQILPCCNDQ
ncbi:Rab family, other [Babesia microti strain RI]|uniref:Rab family, other n=1 Tax=Babesia microti (strain RI) TaxID=1133968 RepID=A0A1R4AAK6_BABMR|nr:Rab family, other [Babesia microti strain RI]SJK86039.1 Rab family, other [Babesia microti strain RI]|eukprot:XP_021338236.1 Rab family, other [Babesia microti strain RI]